MIKTDKSKRSFFKKMAAAVGFVASAGYLSKWMFGRSHSVQQINNNSANYVNKQKKAWQQKQMVAMTDADKKQMLDDIFKNHSLDCHNLDIHNLAIHNLDIHNKDHA